MRSIAIVLLGLACAVPCFAAINPGEAPVFACIGTHSALPPETWFPDVSAAREFCDARAAFTTPGSVTETIFPSSSGDYTAIAYNYSGARSGGSIIYTMVEYRCLDPLAGFDKDAFECVGGQTELTTDDIAVYVGYILGSFALGYSMGWVFRAFYKAADMI